MSNPTDEILDSIQQKQSEACRLVATLRYYQWLESVGLSWDRVKGVKKVVKGYRTWGCISKTYIDFLLVDGTRSLHPWPPFHDDVIYNCRRYVEKSED